MSQDEKVYNAVNKKFLIKPFVIILVIMVFISLFAYMAPFEVIQTGEKGVVLKLGAIQDYVLDEGFHFKIPIVTKIEKITVQPISLLWKVEVGNNGAITKDNQTIGATVESFYVYEKDSLIRMRKEFGLSKMREIILSTIKENFKDVIGKYTIFEVAESREAIKEEVITGVISDLDGYPVVLTELKINNFDWSDEFDYQIEATMKKAQEVKKAEQELLMTEKESQKQVKEAESQKTALITKAEGEKEAAALMADAKALEGEGIKKYNAALQATLETELKIRALEIEKIKAEKWNGQYVPNNMYGPIPVNTIGGVFGQ